ncbi:hypothetical protein MLD38_023794 [Melastoma candidum]|uniref:Uncharacterized protein n=1 Tax=Melastoma candidum TaxID=119954 RepID=A0ACB9NRX3_9MYRT|nr:hypothetical protein MLD38_023794 [Melastoma candidum]
MNMKQRTIFLISLNSLAILVASVIFFLIFIVHVKSPFEVSPSSMLELKGSSARFGILIGVLTRADLYAHRHFLRMLYGIQSSPLAEIDVKFVFCNLTKPEQRILIALEIQRFNDIVILNCTENMNSGKTHMYFSSLPRILPRLYNYVMKADDDVYIRLEPLARSLAPLPRSDLYYGFVIPCNSMNPFVEYMSGMGYILSWDLVEWIADADIPEFYRYGSEDKMVAQWLKMGNKAKNRFTNKPAMYDYPGTNGRCSHELIPETVAVHRLKRWDQWSRVLEYFNVTRQINDSKLYHF